MTAAPARPVVTLLFGPPPVALSPNGGHAIWARSRARKAYKAACVVAAWEQLGTTAPPPLAAPVTAQATIVYLVYRKRDEDNFGAMLKPLWDALVLAGLLPGDDADVLHLLPIVFERGPKAGVRVVLEGATQ